mmetsp:Transcript_6440/g.12322  ORF Transcript_6440/g.12322 Transcript_6440/m.12322 type:complete len:1163 (+) Transcript_6440:244-3732(+)
MAYTVAVVAGGFRAFLAVVFGLISFLALVSGDYGVMFGPWNRAFKRFYYATPVLNVMCLSVAFPDGGSEGWSVVKSYWIASSLGLGCLTLLMAYLVFDMPDEDVLRHFGDPKRLAGLFAFICAITLLDVYVFVAASLDEMESPASFYAYVLLLSAYSWFTHINSYLAFLTMRKFFLEEDTSDHLCEELLHNFNEKYAKEIGGSNYEKALSPPLFAVRNKISSALHNSCLHMCHDKISLGEDVKRGTNNMGRAAPFAKERTTLMKTAYERLQRMYQATADRSLRSLLYVDCLLPGMAAVQRTKSTRSLLIGHASRVSMGFHDDAITSDLRRRMTNLDDNWWYQCRASFFLAMERLVRGFPTLWSPNEEFFRQCEDLVHKYAFQREIEIRFYLVDTRNNTRLDLQPYLLEDLRVETAKADNIDILGLSRSGGSPNPPPSPPKVSSSISKARLGARNSIKVPAEPVGESQSDTEHHHHHHHHHTRRVVTLYIPLNVNALTEREKVVMQHQKEESAVGSRPTSPVRLTDDEEQRKTNMALWDIMPLGTVSPVKAGRIAALSFLRHFVFRESHDKIKKTLNEFDAPKKKTLVKGMTAKIMPVGGRLRRDSTHANVSVTTRSRARRLSLSGPDALTGETTVKLPYREPTPNSLRRAKAHNMFTMSPENIIGSVVLSGMLADKDLTDDIMKEFNENNMKLCRSAVVDNVTHQQVPFLTTNVNSMIEDEIAKTKKSWEFDCWGTVIVFTLVDAFAILLTVLDDFAFGPTVLQRVNMVFKYVSCALLVVLTWARATATSASIARMNSALDQVMYLKNLRLAMVLKSHVNFELSYNMSLCSMVYLYGRGIPGCIINASFFLYMINQKRQASLQESQDGADCATGSEDYGMELATVAAMILSFITALSYSKAKLLNLYSTQMKTSLDHLNSLLQTSLTRMKMDIITDMSYKAAAYSDPQVVDLPDLTEEDNGHGRISSEIDTIQRAVNNDDGFSKEGGNAYDNTIRHTGNKTNGTAVSFGSHDLGGSKNRTRTSNKTKTKRDRGFNGGPDEGTGSGIRSAVKTGSGTFGKSGSKRIGKEHITNKAGDGIESVVPMGSLRSVLNRVESEGEGTGNKKRSSRKLGALSTGRGLLAGLLTKKGSTPNNDEGAEKVHVGDVGGSVQAKLDLLLADTK